MRFPAILWERLNDFTTQRHTGQCILHFHEGLLTKYELTHVVKVPYRGDYVVSHGLLVVEDE